MTVARNEDYWLEIYDLPAYQPGQGFDASKIYEWTEKLEKEGKMRGLDLIMLKRIIELAFQNGKQARDD